MAIAVGAGIGGLLLQQLLDGLNTAADKALNEAANHGNALLAKLGTEANVAAQNAIYALSEDLNKAIGQLSEPIQQLAMDLYELKNSVELAVDAAFHIEDAMAIDLTNLIGQTIFGEEVFVLRRISGLVQLERDSDYEFALTGTNLGSGTNRYRSHINFRIKATGEDLVGSVQQAAQNEATITVPSNKMSQLFNEDAPVALDLELDILYTRLAHGLHGAKGNHYIYPVRVTLLPRISGTGTVVCAVPISGWAPDGTVSSGLLRTDDNGYKPARGYSLDVKVEHPKRLRNARLVCMVDQEGSGRFRSETVYSYSNDESVVTCAWVQGSWPTTYRLDADVVRPVVTSMDPRPVVFEFTYGQERTVEIPRDTSSYRVSGKTVEKRHFDFVEGTVDPTGTLTILRRTRNEAGPDLLVMQPAVPHGVTIG